MTLSKTTALVLIAYGCLAACVSNSKTASQIVADYIALSDTDPMKAKAFLTSNSIFVIYDIGASMDDFATIKRALKAKECSTLVSGSSERMMGDKGNAYRVEVRWKCSKTQDFGLTEPVLFTVSGRHILGARIAPTPQRNEQRGLDNDLDLNISSPSR